MKASFLLLLLLLLTSCDIAPSEFGAVPAAGTAAGAGAAGAGTAGAAPAAGAGGAGVAAAPAVSAAAIEAARLQSQGLDPSVTPLPPLPQPGQVQGQGQIQDPSLTPLQPPAQFEARKSRRYPQDRTLRNEDLSDLAGVRETHVASSPTKCNQIDRWFKSKGLRLTLTIYQNPQPGRKTSRKNGLYFCVFEGPDAVEQRFGLNDDYDAAGGLNYPQHVNDYMDGNHPYTTSEFQRQPYTSHPPPPPGQ